MGLVVAATTFGSPVRADIFTNDCQRPSDETVNLCHLDESGSRSEGVSAYIEGLSRRLPPGRTPVATAIEVLVNGSSVVRGRCDLRRDIERAFTCHLVHVRRSNPIYTMEWTVLVIADEAGMVSGYRASLAVGLLPNTLGNW